MARVCVWCSVLYLEISSRGRKVEVSRNTGGGGQAWMQNLPSDLFWLAIQGGGGENIVRGDLPPVFLSKCTLGCSSRECSGRGWGNLTVAPTPTLRGDVALCASAVKSLC